MLDGLARTDEMVGGWLIGGGGGGLCNRYAHRFRIIPTFAIRHRTLNRVSSGGGRSGPLNG